MSTYSFHDRATWKAYWQRTREHWSLMKHYGSWDGRAQFFGEWRRVFTFTQYGKSGKVLSRYTKTHIGSWNRYEVAERWAAIKKYLKPGQSATITLNGRVSKQFFA